MWVISKDKKCVVNSDAIDSFYSVTTAVRARFARANKDLTLGEYPSSELAIQALCMVHRALATRADAVEMPNNERVQAAYIQACPNVKDRAADGKKTVRRGGS